METKYWYQSKTVWFNVVTGALAIVALPQFISILPVATEPYIALVNAAGNWILRMYFTTSTIIPVPPTENNS